MLNKKFLSILFITTSTFIIWIYAIRISRTDYKKEPVQLRRYLEARASSVVTTHRTLVTRNESSYQKGITRIVSSLKREFASKDLHIY